MSFALRCDHDTCDTLEKIPDDTTVPMGWYRVQTDDLGRRDKHFCSVNCLLVFYARKQPLESWPSEPREP